MQVPDQTWLASACSGYVTGTEKTIIKKALERTKWNRKKAAGLLDISYKSLLNKIMQYRLAQSDRMPFDSIRNNGS
mgnify:CR=1 FL=1